MVSKISNLSGLIDDCIEIDSKLLYYCFRHFAPSWLNTSLVDEVKLFNAVLSFIKSFSFEGEKCNTVTSILNLKKTDEAKFYELFTLEVIFNQLFDIFDTLYGKSIKTYEYELIEHAKNNIKNYLAIFCQTQLKNVNIKEFAILDRPCLRYVNTTFCNLLDEFERQPYFRKSYYIYLSDALADIVRLLKIGGSDE